MPPRTPRTTPAAQPSRWLLTLFALPFAAVGVGMLLLSVLPTLYDWTRMQSWQPVDATLLSARLDVHSGKSRTYSVSARYRFEVAGRTLEGQRVAISEGADNIGDFHQRLGERLERAQAQGQTVRAWVDPSNPADAVIDRSLRGGLLAFKMAFVLLFGGVGLGLLVFAWRSPQTTTPRPPAAPPRRAAQRDDTSALEAIPGGMRLTQPYARAWQQKLPLAGVGVALLALALFLDGEEAPLAVLLGIGGMGAVVLAASLFSLANSRRVELGTRGLRTERRLLGLLLSWHQVPPQDIARLDLKESYTTQTGSRSTTFYCVQVVLRDGQAITVADSLRGRKAAEHLVRTLARGTGYAGG